MSLNHASISGNLGKDAELRFTQTGTAVLGFSVAVNESVPDGQGGYKERPNWIQCTVFGKRAEGLAPYLTKGCKVAVEGRLRQSSWERDGERRSRVEIVVEHLDFMSRTQLAPQAPQAPQQTEEPNYPDLYAEDIPF